MKVVETIRTENYIKVRLDPTTQWQQMHDADTWCRECNCGKQVSLKHFAFKTEEEFTMFRLKWLT